MGLEVIQDGMKHTSASARIVSLPNHAIGPKYKVPGYPNCALVAYDDIASEQVENYETIKEKATQETMKPNNKIPRTLDGFILSDNFEEIQELFRQSQAISKQTLVPKNSRFYNPHEFSYEDVDGTIKDDGYASAIYNLGTEADILKNRLKDVTTILTGERR